MERILIYTDGSSRGNPGPGGWGAIIALPESVEELGGFEARTTNNRMELQAVLEALTTVAVYPDAQIVIRADSQYVINGATKWWRGWQARDWKTLDKKDVSNRDIWEPTIALLKSISKRVTFENVGGHINIPGNERADTIATSFALSKSVSLYKGPREEYAIDLETVVHDVAAKQKKSDTKSRSSAKTFSYVSAVGGEIKIHTTWDECKKRVAGHKARYKKAVSKDDEERLVREFSL